MSQKKQPTFPGEGRPEASSWTETL